MSGATDAIIKNVEAYRTNVRFNFDNNSATLNKLRVMRSTVRRKALIVRSRSGCVRTRRAGRRLPAAPRGPSAGAGAGAGAGAEACAPRARGQRPSAGGGC